MIYEVRANLFFSNPDEAKDFYHDCQLALPKAIVVNPNTQHQECSVIEFLDCHHDEAPNQPCSLTLHEDNCPSPP